MNVQFETDCPQGIRILIDQIYKEAAKRFRLPQKTEVLVSFLSEREIQKVNFSSRGINRVTDVLSFPYINAARGRNITLKANRTDINPFTKRLMLGEVNICTRMARKQAEEYGHSFERECGYLALHGFLHIIGFDHEKEQDRKRMRAAEEKILEALKITR